METGSQNIYHVDEPPHLARRRSPVAPSSGVVPEASRAYRRVEAGQAPRLHQDHRQRIRRRRGEHSSGAMFVNKLLWLGLLLVVGLYGALLVFSTLRARHRVAAPAEAEAPAPSPEEPRAAEAAIDFRAELDTLRKAHSLALESAADFDAGKTASALEKARRAVELAPELTAAYRELARARQAERDYAGAEEAWRFVLARDPLNNEARVQLAAVFLARGHYANALAAARWGLEQDSYSEDAHEIAAAALTAMDMPKEAIPHLRRLSNLNRDDRTARNNLGLAYLRLNDFKSAEAAFREVLTADPGNSVAFYNLAVCHARQQEASQTVEILEEAARKFGSAFVLAWTQSKDFDPIRSAAPFARYVELGATSSGASNGSEPREAPVAASDAASL